ncbi:hypothetical protein EQH57_0062 [Dictyocoela roeselum]|nr:hypothetical protein EQH57_0062 [Dictyocoela roeselum]
MYCFVMILIFIIVFTANVNNFDYEHGNTHDERVDDDELGSQLDAELNEQVDDGENGNQFDDDELGGQSDAQDDDDFEQGKNNFYTRNLSFSTMALLICCVK